MLPFGGMLALSYEAKGAENTLLVSSCIMLLIQDLISREQSLFPKLHYRAIAATFTFYLPIYRDLLLLGGAELC